MSAVGRIVCFGIYILLIAFVLMTLPKFGGFTVMLSELPAEYSSMGNMPTQRIIAWILGGCLSTAVMQSVLQPLLAAKSASAARTGSILGYVLAAPICLLTATCGIFAKASGADLGDGATAFAYSIKTFSNPAFAGIIFAFATMIIAATMATMMLATGTIITNVYKNDINPNVDDAKLLKLSKIITFVFAYLTLDPCGHHAQRRPHQPVPHPAARGRRPGELRHPGGPDLEALHPAGGLLGHGQRHGGRCGLDAAGPDRHTGGGLPHSAGQLYSGCCGISGDQ